VSISNVTSSVSTAIPIERSEPRDSPKPANAPGSLLSGEVRRSFDSALEASLPMTSPPAHLAAGTAAPQKPSVDQVASCGAGFSPAGRMGGRVSWWVTAETGVTVLRMTEDGARSR